MYVCMYVCMYVILKIFITHFILYIFKTIYNFKVKWSINKYYSTIVIQVQYS